MKDMHLSHPYDVAIDEQMSLERIATSSFFAESSLEKLSDYDCAGTVGSAGTFGGTFGTIGTWGCCC